MTHLPDHSCLATLYEIYIVLILTEFVSYWNFLQKTKIEIENEYKPVEVARGK